MAHVFKVNDRLGVAFEYGRQRQRVFLGLSAKKPADWEVAKARADEIGHLIAAGPGHFDPIKEFPDDDALRRRLGLSTHRDYHTRELRDQAARNLAHR